MIGDAYADVFDRRPPRLVDDEVGQLLDLGMEPVVIMWALDATAAAPRPSWAYTRAILAACIREGCRTAAEWQARQDRWASRKRRRASAPAQPDPLNYPQRTYSDDERSSFYVRFD